MPVSPNEIATLIELFNASDWDELHVEIDGLHLFLSTDPHARLTSGPHAAAPVAVTPVAAAVPPPVVTAPGEAPVATAQAGATGQAPLAPAVVPANWVAVTAPNLGTFYRSPKPGADPFVTVGQRVEPATEICLLEVMKLFTTVRAGVAGTVRQICAEDAEMVEHGQILFYIEP